MNIIRFCALWCCVLAAPWFARAADEVVSAKLFADGEGRLDQARAAMYIVARDAIPLTQLTAAQPRFAASDLARANGRLGVLFDTDKLIELVADQLDDLRSLTGHEAPWTADELDLKAARAAPAPAVSGGLSLPAVTTELKLGPAGRTRLGPIQLRKNADEIGKDLKDAKGLSLGYAENRLTDEPGAWSSEGIVYWPARMGGSAELGAAAEWKLDQNHDATRHDVEEVTYSLPARFYFAPASSASALWVAQSKPYYQTDFSGGHQIVGLEFSGEFVGRLGRTLFLGAFQNLGNGSTQYQLRAVPKLNYSHVRQEGRHSARRLGDDWLRLGALLSLEVRFGARTATPLDVGVSYEFAYNLRQDGGSGDLLKLSATWWANRNVGFTAEYAYGDTPIADAPIDLLKLGFEFKY